MNVSRRWSWTLAAFAAAIALTPLPASSQATPLATAAPWTVTITPGMNPLPIGFCSAVLLNLFDPSTKDVPRNRLGYRLSMADFDMSVTTPSGTVAVGQQIDRFNWSVCGCQAGAPGTVATITATYPSQTLATESRVQGVAFQKTAEVILGDPKSSDNPAGCPPPGAPVLGSPLGTAAPAPRQPAAAVTVTALAPANAPIVAVAPALSSAASAATAAPLPVAPVPIAPPTEGGGAPRIPPPPSGAAIGRITLPGPLVESTETPLFGTAGAWQVNGNCNAKAAILYFLNTGTIAVDVASSSLFRSVPAGGRLLLEYGAGTLTVLQIGSGSGARSQVSTVIVSTSVLGLPVRACTLQWSVLGN